ncbi:uncharacterized protein LOC133716267 [Rosa rugosa]|uniref:uncharacterized protein LOC133716267 n=1 Tax=Rosa rugosa TaxID=74645 RepID=UPI002B4036DC|nr:uncharacterized protein LOC133716267 [Rosa rugosa]
MSKMQISDEGDYKSPKKKTKEMIEDMNMAEADDKEDRSYDIQQQLMMFPRSNYLKEQDVQDFHKRFTSSNRPSNTDMNNFLSPLQPCITEEDNLYLLKQVTEEDIKDATSSGGAIQNIPKVIKWHPPPEDKIKINFDGSVSSSEATCGFICKDTNGNLTMAMSKNIGTTTVPTAEATALRDSLWMAIQKGYKNVQVEGDSKIVIDAVNGKISPPWRLAQIINDIRKIVCNFESISFSHIYREANFAADACANLRHNYAGEKV